MIVQLQHWRVHLPRNTFPSVGGRIATTIEHSAFSLVFVNDKMLEVYKLLGLSISITIILASICLKKKKKKKASRDDHVQRQYGMKWWPHHNLMFTWIEITDANSKQSNIVNPLDVVCGLWEEKNRERKGKLSNDEKQKNICFHWLQWEKKMQPVISENVK